MRLIDADELNRIIEESIADLGPVYYTGQMIYAMRMVCEYATEGAPTIDAVLVRHGYLVNAHPYGECSECGYLIDSRDGYNYCPHCGAKMDAERRPE